MASQTNILSKHEIFQRFESWTTSACGHRDEKQIFSELLTLVIYTDSHSSITGSVSIRRIPNYTHGQGKRCLRYFVS